MSDNLQDVVFDDTTETEGFRAYKAGLKAGAVAERERIRQQLERILITHVVSPEPPLYALLDELRGRP